MRKRTSLIRSNEMIKGFGLILWCSDVLIHVPAGLAFHQDVLKHMVRWLMRKGAERQLECEWAHYGMIHGAGLTIDV